MYVKLLSSDTTFPFPSVQFTNLYPKFLVVETFITVPSSNEFPLGIVVTVPASLMLRDVFIENFVADNVVPFTEPSICTLLNAACLFAFRLLTVITNVNVLLVAKAAGTLSSNLSVNFASPACLSVSRVLLFLRGISPVAKVSVVPSSFFTATSMVPPSVPHRLMFALIFVGVKVRPFVGFTLNSITFEPLNLRNVVPLIDSLELLFPPQSPVAEKLVSVNAVSGVLVTSLVPAVNGQTTEAVSLL